MEHSFWLERWQRGETGFHQAHVQPALIKHWPALNCAKGSTVLVPLCGKSLDMIWLAEQGFHVVGVELSDLAAAEFFAERRTVPANRTDGPFTVSTAGGVEIWCGDFFALDAAQLPPISAAYDRAALVAMPPEMQARYAAKLAEFMPARSKTLLIGLDYNRDEISGPPFAISQGEVRTLLDPYFTVDVLDARDGLARSEHLKKRGVTRLEEASYLLRRTP